MRWGVFDAGVVGLACWGVAGLLLVGDEDCFALRRRGAEKKSSRSKSDANGWKRRKEEMIHLIDIRGEILLRAFALLREISILVRLIIPFTWI